MYFFVLYNLPNATPTAPTYTPSEQQQDILSYSVIIPTSLLREPCDFSSIDYSVMISSYSSVAVVDEAHVRVTNVTCIEGEGSLIEITAAVAVAEESTYTALWEMGITLNLVDYPDYDGDSSTLAQDLEKVTATAMQDGSFLETLQSTAILVDSVLGTVEVDPSLVVFSITETLYSPTDAPTTEPSVHPTTVPTAIPTTSQPTTLPTTVQPTTVTPTAIPSFEPTFVPSTDPTADPSVIPTETPTERPTARPSAIPTALPTVRPTPNPTVFPSADPSADPSGVPTAVPNADPSAVPSADPSAEPTSPPTEEPTSPSLVTANLTTQPTHQPSTQPTVQPVGQPTLIPTTSIPTTAIPTATPTFNRQGETTLTVFENCPVVHC
jgi:hypothetical protein